MFYALNFQNQLIHASLASKSDQYFCPTCYQQVRLRISKLNICYFAHIHSVSIKDRHETNIHRTGKQLLMKWGAELGYEVQTEIYFKDIKRRADIVLVQKDRQVIMEYQCSPITTTELLKRSKAYSRIGLQYIWIVGKKYQLQGKISQQNAQFFKYHPNIGFYYIYLNVEMQRFELYYQIQKGIFLPDKYQIKFLANLKELIQFIRGVKENYLNNISIKMRTHQFRNLSRIEKYSKGITHTLQVQCYLKHLEFHQEILKVFSLSYNYPIYRYSKEYYQIGMQLGLNAEKFIYRMPFVNYRNFI